LAELFYRGATFVIDNQQIPRYESLKDWQHIFHNVTNQFFEIEELNTISPLRFSQLIASAGDAVLNRIYYHVQSSDFHLSEQLDKNTGEESSATDLTWSYANVFKAMWYRDNYSKTAVKTHPFLKHTSFFKTIKWH